MDIVIRAEQKKDFGHIKNVNDKAFDQENGGKLVEALRNTSKYMPSLSLVAEINNEIVSHILFFYPSTQKKQSLFFQAVHFLIMQRF